MTKFTLNAKHGMPQVVISDQGTVFISKFIKDLYDLLQIKGNASTAFHPQTDGQTEWINQEVKKNIFASLSTTFRATGLNGSPLPPLLITTKFTHPLAKVLLKSTTAITLPFFQVPDQQFHSGPLRQPPSSLKCKKSMPPPNALSKRQLFKWKPSMTKRNDHQLIIK